MGKFRSIVCFLLIFAVCCGLCGCSGLGTKYKVHYKDGSEQQLTIKQICELYNQEPTRDNPNPKSLLESAIISGTGTVTSFECETDTSTTLMETGQYHLDLYHIGIDNKVKINFRTPKDSRGVKFKLYNGEKVNFIGKLNGTTDGSISLIPENGYVLYADEQPVVSLIK